MSILTERYQDLDDALNGLRGRLVVPMMRPDGSDLRAAVERVSDAQIAFEEVMPPEEPVTFTSDELVAGPAEYSNYVDRVFQHLEHELITGGYDLGDIAVAIDAHPELYRMYALLAMTTGVETSSEHVHDAWSMWCYVGFPEHRSIVPFDQLTPEVQGYDDAFRDAIRKVAADLPRLVS